MAFTASSADKNYMVIDLSGGADDASCPITYLDAVPEGGWTDEYKTGKLVLRRIEAGTFTMGSPSGEVEKRHDALPHEVTLTKPYYIGVFEVTQRQWEIVMASNPSFFKAKNTNPVEGVTHDAVVVFIEKLRSKTGQAFDLPTEAQWEYACRAGTTTEYSFGEDAKILYRYANFCDVSNTNDFPVQDKTQNDGHDKMATVGSYLPNPWGLFDMHGNVWEWCSDWYGPNYGTAAVRDPQGSPSGSLRVHRGGGWNSGRENCRSTNRAKRIPSGKDRYIGFRPALTLP